MPGLLAMAALGWVTCPVTQCGFVRISCNPSIIADAVSPREAAKALMQMAAEPHHHFGADDVPLSHADVPLARAVGYRQITDAYLLGLAIHHQGCLVTLDRGISSLLPPGMSDALIVVSNASHVR